MPGVPIGLKTDGSGFEELGAVGGGAPPDVQLFTSDGTWTKPTGPNGEDPVWTEVYGYGEGGGGGAGAYGDSATTSFYGGGRGGRGGRSYVRLATSELPSTVAVVVGSTGVGGAAITAAGNGPGGANGSNASFGEYLVASGGTKGFGGDSWAYGTPGTDGDGNAPGEPFMYGTDRGTYALMYRGYNATSGRGGNGSNGSLTVGLAGGRSLAAGGSTATTPAATAGADGANQPPGGAVAQGGAGGGGGKSGTGNGGDGGDGGFPGGGGGGGGGYYGADASGSSGGGGHGGGGCILAITYF